MHFKLVAPLVHDRYRWDRGGITQRAKTSAQYALRQVLDIVDVLAQAAAVMEAGERLLEPVCAFTAGNAPAAAFMLVKLHHAQREFDHASIFVAYNDAAGAEEASCLSEGVEIEIDGFGFGSGTVGAPFGMNLP